MTNPTADQPQQESETARRVRWSTTATEAYTALYSLYEELRATGHAYAWSAAYEASGQAGVLLAELRTLLNTPDPDSPEQQAADTHAVLRARADQVYALLEDMETALTTGDTATFARVLSPVARLGEDAYQLKELVALSRDQLGKPRPTQEAPCPGQ